MNMALCAVLAVTSAFFALYLKSVRSDYALLVTLASVIFILASIMPRVVMLTEDIVSFADKSSISFSYVGPVLKIIGIAYITEIASDICSDAGEKAMASHVEAFGKVTAAVIAMPIIEDVFSLILNLLE